MRAAERRRRRSRNCPGRGIPGRRRGLRKCAGACGGGWEREGAWWRPGCEWRDGRRRAGDVLRGEFGNEVERDAGRPGDGLVFVPDEARQCVEKVFHADDDLGVFGPDGPGDVAGVGELTEFGFLVADGEGLDRSREVALHESGDGGRIQAAGEKHTERDVAHETHADGLLEAVAAFGDPGGIAARLGLGIRNVPVLADLGLRRRSGEVEREVMAVHQLMDAAKEGAVFADVSKGQVFGEERLLELGRNGRVFKEGLDFAGEGERASIPIVVEGLLAEAVAGTEEFTGVLIPDGKGEHAAEAENACGAVLLVGVEDSFGIGASGVAVAGLFQGGAEGGVIEDFAVEDDKLRRVFIGHRLVAARDIDNGEASEPEGGPRVAVITGIIGAAVADGVRHALDDRGRVGRLNSYKSCDSTHERVRWGTNGRIPTLACGYGRVRAGNGGGITRRWGSAKNPFRKHLENYPECF